MDVYYCGLNRHTIILEATIKSQYVIYEYMNSWQQVIRKEEKWCNDATATIS